MPTLPRFVRPMLARPGQPFDSLDHLFEVKWDGMRALAFVDRDGQRIVSRHGNDLTEQFPELACLARLPPGTGNWSCCGKAYPTFRSWPPAIKFAPLRRSACRREPPRPC